jgi:hypothetical protein
MIYAIAEVRETATERSSKESFMKMATLALGALVLLAVPNTHRFTCEQECLEKYCHTISKRRFVCQNECLMKCHLQRSEQAFSPAAAEGFSTRF